MKIGQWLLRDRSDRKLVSFLAERLEVTPKTLRNWRAMVQRGEAAKTGRPSYSSALKASARAAVQEQMRRQGHPGWRPIAKALPEFPVRLIQAEVGRIKAYRRKRLRNLRAKQRITTRVLAREAIWTVDGTLTQGRGSPEAQVVKDRGSLSYRAIRTGPVARDKDVTSLLEQTRDQTGLPFVLSTDNGSIYCSAETQAFLEKEKVIHLRSLPRTPQHNGAAEIGIRQAKEALPVQCTDSGAALLNTCATMNKYRLYATKGFKSANQLDEKIIAAYTRVKREEFYEKCMKRVWRVRCSTLPWREKRRAEREVILTTLQEYKLIERTRGGKPYQCQNVEIFL